jgi:hypothetical protein
MLVGLASTIGAQVPGPIPSDVPNQILSLTQRVSALEQKLAAVTNGTTPMRVRAPFVVVDAGGRPILQVVEGVGNGSAGPGILIAGAPASGHTALSLLNKAGSPIVGILNLPSGEQGIALYDDAGRLRAGVGVDGQIETWDESGSAVLAIAPNVTKKDAAIRIGKDEDGYALQVGGGPDVARLGEDSEGGGLLTLSDEQGDARANITGSGELQLWDSSNKGILTVAEDVTGDDAVVRIGGSDDGTQISVGSGRSVVMGVDGDIAGFGILQGKAPRAGLAVTASGTHLNLANGNGTTVVNLEVGQGGQGKLQLGKPDGSSSVEAGLGVDGVGLVQVFPSSGLTTAPGTILQGRKK